VRGSRPAVLASAEAPEPAPAGAPLPEQVRACARALPKAGENFGTRNSCSLLSLQTGCVLLFRVRSNANVFVECAAGALAVSNDPIRGPNPYQGLLRNRKVNP